MRVALVNHRYLPFRGGSEVYVQKIAEWLASLRVETHVFTTNAFDLEYFWDPASRTVMAPACEVIGGVKVRRCPVEHPPLSRWLFPAARRGMGEASRVIPWSPPYSLVSTRVPRIGGLRAALEAEGSFDVIVGTNLGLEGLAIEALSAARRSGAAFVLAPFAHLGEGPESTARRYVSMPHHRRLVRDADLLIALTRMEACFLENLGAESGRMVVAGAGVDLPVDSMASRESQAGGVDGLPTILSIGALAPDKGTTHLVEASRMLWSCGVRHRLVLVGPELSSFGGWFRDTGADGCEWIERRGVVAEGEKQSLLASADVVALPSRTESFGIVYLEAWAYRKPVIGAAVGAILEVISDGSDGLLVPFGDIPALARAIGGLLEQPSVATRLGHAGYAKVTREFTWDHVYQRLEGALEDALGLRLR